MFFKSKQQIMIFIAAAVMLLGFVFFVNLPLERKMQAVESEIAVTKALIDGANNRKERLPELRKQFQQMKNMTEQFELNMPEKRELGSFLHQIADLMNQHNLKNQFIEPGEEIKTEKLNCIPVSLKCRGRLAQLFEFYKSLQNSNRLIRIEYVSLENKSDPGSDIDMETKAVIYYRPTKEKG